jgi:hypothetical protein
MPPILPALAPKDSDTNIGALQRSPSGFKILMALRASCSARSFSPRAMIAPARGLRPRQWSRAAPASAKSAIDCSQSGIASV